MLTSGHSSVHIAQISNHASSKFGVNMNLVIVESPAKAKTIEKYLGKDYKVLASFGHVRDLPSKTGSVRPDEDFAMDWSVDTKSKTRISDIVKALKSSDKLILATDPDREGEAISWHLLEVLNKKKALKGKQVERVVFNAITKKSVTDAIKAPASWTWNWSMLIWHDALLIIWSALLCRQSYGVNCQAHVRLAVCNRFACG